MHGVWRNHWKIRAKALKRFSKIRIGTIRRTPVETLTNGEPSSNDKEKPFTEKLKRKDSEMQTQKWSTRTTWVRRCRRSSRHTRSKWETRTARGTRFRGSSSTGKLWRSSRLIDRGHLCTPLGRKHARCSSKETISRSRINKLTRPQTKPWSKETPRLLKTLLNTRRWFVITKGTFWRITT